MVPKKKAKDYNGGAVCIGTDEYTQIIIGETYQQENDCWRALARAIAKIPYSKKNEQGAVIAQVLAEHGCILSPRLPKCDDDGVAIPYERVQLISEEGKTA